jgi:hypothetical protein
VRFFLDAERRRRRRRYFVLYCTVRGAGEELIFHRKRVSE